MSQVVHVDEDEIIPLNENQVWNSFLVVCSEVNKPKKKELSLQTQHVSLRVTLELETFT